MLKHKHPEFQSDIYTMLETVGAQLEIGNFDFYSYKYLLWNSISFIHTYFWYSALEYLKEAIFLSIIKICCCKYIFIT